jgi:hypothetical protein
MICNGECGSKHPHSRIFAQQSTSFFVLPESSTDFSEEEIEKKEDKNINVLTSFQKRDDINH